MFIYKLKFQIYLSILFFIILEIIKLLCGKLLLKFLVAVIYKSLHFIKIEEFQLQLTYCIMLSTAKMKHAELSLFK